MPEGNNILASTMAQYVPAAASQLGQGGFGLLGQYMNYKYNQVLAAQQNQYNLEMWRMTNEYNSPQAQMQRFKDAGLNPNLIYGQGNNGNASGSPQMVVPNAPDYTKGMQEMAKAFNIENLRTLVANRKKAEADAENAKTNATRNFRVLNAERNFGVNWEYDYSTGRYKLRNTNEVNVIDPSAYYFNRLLENNFNRSYLLPYRAGLYEYQKNYLAPQIKMANYQERYYPYSFWIDRGAKVASGIGDLVGIFNPLKWFRGFKRPPISYTNYNYYH